jgi:hypothetical protein
MVVKGCGITQMGVQVMTKDNINPNHYKQGNIEVIDFILDQKLNYLEGNVIKYLSRYKKKNGLEDLHKAEWYLKELIKGYDNENN